MKLLINFFTFSLFATMQAQSLMPSNTYIRTCLKETECASINSSSYVFYDETKNKFYLKIDFNLMKSGIDSVDFWLEDLNDTYLYFKATLPKEQFPNLSSYNTTNFNMQGQVFLNGVWRDQTIPLSIYRAEHDLLSNTTNGNQFEAYKVNFSFAFSPKDFNIHKKPQRLTNTVFIGVGAGQINLLRSGQENEVGEAFNR